jgi:hypothetical protein
MRSIGQRFIVALCCVIALCACDAYDSGLLNVQARGPKSDAGKPGDGGPTSEGGLPSDGGPDACAQASEECNRADDDCDGKTDEDAVLACESVILNADTDCVPFGAVARCVLVKCRDGFANCDGNPANGCEPFCMCNECSDAGDDDAGP